MGIWRACIAWITVCKPVLIDAWKSPRKKRREKRDERVNDQQWTKRGIARRDECSRIKLQRDVRC